MHHIRTQYLDNYLCALNTVPTTFSRKILQNQHTWKYLKIKKTAFFSLFNLSFHCLGSCLGERGICLRCDCPLDSKLLQPQTGHPPLLPREFILLNFACYCLIESLRSFQGEKSEKYLQIIKIFYTNLSSRFLLTVGIPVG